MSYYYVFTKRYTGHVTRVYSVTNRDQYAHQI